MRVRHFADGVLQGMITDDDGGIVDFVYTGSALDLMKVAMFLGLEPEDDADESLSHGQPVNLSRPSGGMAVLRPTEKASDLLMSIIVECKENGVRPPPFI